VGVIEDTVPGGLPNAAYMRSLCKTYHCTVVGVQSLEPGQTDDTPQVVNLLAAKPQIIVLGLIPGQDTVTAIKAIRAESSTIPISECSTCWTPGFVQAAGGPEVLANVYLREPVLDVLRYLPGAAANRAVISQITTYVAAMKAAGFEAAEDIDNAVRTWPSLQALTAAIRSARSLDETAVMHALEHQKIETLDVFWDRTPANHAGLSHVVTLTETWAPTGQVELYRS
jgi:ABC-type branched-subunit amino acid transport system substrate-binding protein